LLRRASPAEVQVSEIFGRKLQLSRVYGNLDLGFGRRLEEYRGLRHLSEASFHETWSSIGGRALSLIEGTPLCQAASV